MNAVRRSAVTALLALALFAFSAQAHHTGHESRTVADCDRVRQDLHDRLAALGHERSVIVAFTTDRKWAL